ncbi:MAG TPA: fructosamine kinase family protein [Anaerolineae bacterium]|nr:fructosamine kinase family protein [Anaerolineae bacterium]
MLTSPRALVEGVVGPSLQTMQPLSGGMIGQVYLVTLGDGSKWVAKVDERAVPQLHIEGYMLDYLARESELPVPEVVHSSERLLLMAYVPGESRFTAGAERMAAELLVGLHRQTKPQFGLERDTLIGKLSQPNEWRDDWVTFFWEQRLWHLGRMAVKQKRMPASLLTRLEKFGGEIEKWGLVAEAPSLVHGDVWATNVLAEGDVITAFIDPAIYYGQREIELAYITLFGTFGKPFFERYEALWPLAPGFWETRCDIYNLYPLLSHVVHFGGSYVGSVASTLEKLGY